MGHSSKVPTGPFDPVTLVGKPLPAYYVRLMFTVDGPMYGAFKTHRRLSSGYLYGLHMPGSMKSTISEALDWLYVHGRFAPKR